MKKPKLTTTLARRACGAVLATGLAFTSPALVNAEDIDLFVGAATVAATNPNILIVIDNSANWNSQKQHWDATLTQGESELRALKTILGDLRQTLVENGDQPKVNLGLMFHRSGDSSAYPDGGILRFAMRPMTIQTVDAFLELIGNPTGCSGTNSLNGTPNCIWANMKTTGIEQTNNSNYGGAMFDAFKYFGGRTSPTYANLPNDQQVTVPAEWNALGQKRHFNQSRPAHSRMDQKAGYTADFMSYLSPILSACAKNFIIFIGNGFPGSENTTSDAAVMLQNANVGGSPALPAQLAVQNFTSITSTSTTTLGTYAPCTSNAGCVSNAVSTYGNLYTDLNGNPQYTCTGGNTVSNTTTLGTNSACVTAGVCATTAQTTFPSPPNPYTSYSCTGGITTGDVITTTFSPTTCISNATCTTQATTAFVSAGGYTSVSCSGGTASGCGGGTRTNWTVTGAVLGCSSPSKKNQTMIGTNGSITPCNSPNLVNQTQNGVKSVISVVPLQTFSTPTKPNYADEWAKFLYLTDVSDLPGQQNVNTYTIDVFKDQQDADETALLFNMAKHGGGRYFQATSESAIIDALRQIMIEIQSVNSVFASASLPINATNRSQNENQVFIGMFRPDGSGSPRWYGNLKRYQIAQFGNEFKLADNSTPPIEAVTTATGFIHPCANSFWTVDSGDSYWKFQNGSAGQCTTAGNQFIFSDAPDGPLVEKGAVAESLRRGNPGKDDPSIFLTAGALSPLPAVNRTLYTCTNVKECCPGCASNQQYELVAFDVKNVSAAELNIAATVAVDPTYHDRLIDFTSGWDTEDDNNDSLAKVPDAGVRASVHGDVAHSRPLPVNYGKDKGGVVMFYGANDGTFRAVRGNNGAEIWAFVAPEHHAKLERLMLKKPFVLYPNQDPPVDGAIRKDYFFDGSAGLFQNKDDSKIWVFPSMRRGGRMVYGFDVTTVDKPALMWKAGCSDPSMTDASTCTSGFEAMGQTWSIPSVALVKGYSTDPDKPVIIMGGGYDTCEDEDVVPSQQTLCAKGRIGNRVYVIDAASGTLVKEFGTIGSVAADVTLVDRDFDGFADQAYAADTMGNLYRIDFVDPTSPGTTRAVSGWTITHIASVATGADRKFLFGPGALAAGNKVYLSITSGDREAPLIVNYPYPFKDNPGVLNRAYMLVDSFATTGLPVDLDGSTMADMSSGSSCSTLSAEAQGKNGWFFDLNENGVGEQGVTSSTIFAGLIFFSTNRPEQVEPGACENKLGQARGYAVNLLNASGAADTLNICGGARSQIFVGGGLPPSPVTGTVPVGADGRPVTVMIGGVQRGGGLSSPIGAQRVTPTITHRRARVYWYTDTDR